MGRGTSPRQTLAIKPAEPFEAAPLHVGDFVLAHFDKLYIGSVIASKQTNLADRQVRGQLEVHTTDGYVKIKSLDSKNQMDTWTYSGKPTRMVRLHLYKAVPPATMSTVINGHVISLGVQVHAHFLEADSYSENAPRRTKTSDLDYVGYVRGFTEDGSYIELQETPVEHRLNYEYVCGTPDEIGVALP